MPAAGRFGAAEAGGLRPPKPSGGRFGLRPAARPLHKQKSPRPEGRGENTGLRHQTVMTLPALVMVSTISYILPMVPHCSLSVRP